MFGQKSVQQTHRQQFVNEIGESVGALRRAAGHFALGAAERLTPTYDRARYAAGRGWDSARGTLPPLYQQMREGAASARMANLRDLRDLRDMRHKPRQVQAWAKAKAKNKNKDSGGNRMRGLATLLAAGAAVGAAGAVMARRRRAQQAEWEEYDPMTGQTYGSRYSDESAYGHRSAREKVASGAANVVDSLSSRAGRIADSLHERSATMHERGQGSGGQPVAEGRQVPVTGPGGSDMTGGPGPTSVPGTVPPGSMSGPGNVSAPRNDRPSGPPLGFPDER